VRMPAAAVLLWTLTWWSVSSAGAPKRNYPYRELRGTVEEFAYHRQWRSYYWREDFTMVVKDEAGTLHRVISREPTPWTDRRLGTTYPGLKVDWKQKPRVHIIGVAAVDRQPEEFYDLKLDAKNTTTAFICRVEVKDKDRSEWKDYYINNWFHRWGEETDKKMLAHYANDDPHYTVYGYVGGIAAPFDAAGRALLKKHEANYGGIIYHGRVVKAKNDIGYEVKVLHLMGRSKKGPNFTYEIFHGNPGDIPKLDNKK
jgi:hypothetical protein